MVPFNVRRLRSSRSRVNVRRVEENRTANLIFESVNISPNISNISLTQRQFLSPHQPLTEVSLTGGEADQRPKSRCRKNNDILMITDFSRMICIF